jgi:hypothetical protein
VQGLADHAFHANGQDGVSAELDALMAMLVAVAKRIGEPGALDLELLAPLDDIAWPSALTVRRCEGFAYYALYPELFLDAARAVPAGAVVIGLRSIGTALAALVASVCAARDVFTVRPTGDVFGRGISASTALEARVRAAAASATIAIVDEGPGLSGSSFGGTADWLERLGIARERILFLPGHAGDLGVQASPQHRARWNGAHRLVGSIDDLFAADQDGGVGSWFADLTGPPTAPPQDISGGGWRMGRDIPADPGREARKFVLHATRGTFLLKFVGLDRIAEAKFARAQALHVAGFSPEPMALRRGMLCERWVAREERHDTPPLGPYLAFCARTFAAQAQGASLASLVEMARYNVGQVLGERSEPLFAGSDEAAAALQPAVRPIRCDGRLHRWEWVPTTERWLKTDAVDHAEAHDLVGCQDVAWDVAGAIVEWDLGDAQGQALIAEVMAGRPEAADLTALMMLCYLGFQIGWWSYASDPAGLAQRDRYVARVEAILQRESRRSC